jgi:hypothetical protein
MVPSAGVWHHHPVSGGGGTTGVLDSDVLGETVPEPRSPAARRLRTPSWVNLRMLIGVLLVLVAVAVGARVVAGADKSVTIWGLSHDLAAGTALTAGDLRPVRVRLYADAPRYLSTAVSPAGQVTNRDLSGGDFLPRSALGPVPDGVLVPLPVDPSVLPPGLSRGDRIDVYAGPASAGDPHGTTRPVLQGAPVQAVSGGRSGLSAGSDKVQLTVRVHRDQESALVAAVAGSTLYVTQHVGGSGR